MDEIYSDPGAPRAGSYYEVVVVPERVSKTKARLRLIWSTFATLFTPQWGWVPYDTEPKFESDVQVVRTADGVVVASFHYKIGGDARDHLVSLEERLRTMSIADFERAVGIKRTY